MSNPSLPGLLYIDDDRRDAQTLDFLMGEECRFRHAGSVEAARALASTEAFSAVLCCQQLPDGTGIAFLSELQRDGHKAFRIMLAGMGGRDAIQKAMDQGVVNFCLEKPVNGCALSAILTLVTEREALRRQNRELIQALDQSGHDLDESQRLFRFLFGALPQASMLCDRHGLILMANRRAEEYCGVGTQVLVGRRAGPLLGFDWDSQADPAAIGENLYLRRVRDESGELVLLMFARP